MSFPYDPTQEKHTAPSREFLDKILPFISKAELSYTEIELSYEWVIKVHHPENSDMYLELFVCNQGATLEGMHNKKTEIQFETITPKNLYALTPDLFKSCLTVLDFKLS